MNFKFYQQHVQCLKRNVCVDVIRRICAAKPVRCTTVTHSVPFYSGHTV